MDGVDSKMFHYFKSLILRGLIELKKNIDYFIKIIEIMSKGYFLDIKKNQLILIY